MAIQLDSTPRVQLWDRVSVGHQEKHERYGPAGSWICTYCARPVMCQCEHPPLNHPATAHLDHVIPRARGGSNDWSNKVVACQACNLSKGMKLYPSEWRPGLAKNIGWVDPFALLPADHDRAEVVGIAYRVFAARDAGERLDLSEISEWDNPGTVIRCLNALHEQGRVSRCIIDDPVTDRPCYLYSAP